MIPPALLLALALAPPPQQAGGEVYFEQTTLTLADGQPTGPGVLSRVWYSGKKMRLEAGGEVGGPAFILRLDKGKAYRLDPAERVAVEMDLARLRARSQMDLAMAGELMGGREEGAARTSQLRPKTVAGHDCRGYRIAAGSAVVDLYLAPAIPMRIDAFADFLEWSGASEAMGGLLAEVRKLPGFPLETRSRINVLGEVRETVSTVTKVKVGPSPPGLFELPRDYRIRAEEPPPEP